MGKVTGFLEFDRHDRKYQPVEERIRHWREFMLPMPENELREQAARCMDCGVPYCHGTNTITGAPTGCPVNNQIPTGMTSSTAATGKRPRAICTPPTISRK
jgi:glutamate synthase (NADPH/NADH) small chain